MTVEQKRNKKAHRKIKVNKFIIVCHHEFGACVFTPCVCLCHKMHEYELHHDKLEHRLTIASNSISYGFCAIIIVGFSFITFGFFTGRLSCSMIK